MNAKPADPAALRKRAARLKKRRAALVRVMRADVDSLRAIIRDRAGAAGAAGVR